MAIWEEISHPQLNLPGRCHRGWDAAEDLPSIKRLMLAVLRDALECLAGRASYREGSNANRSVEEAAGWIADTNEREVFSFNSVCYVLGLDAAAVRKALIDWPATGLRMSRRSPVAREPVKLSLAPYRKRSPSIPYPSGDNRALFKA
jgi:hypothetical protein